MLLKKLIGKLLMAVDQNQLWTLASETRIKLTGFIPPPLTRQYHMSATCTAQIGAASTVDRPRNLPHTRKSTRLCHHLGYIVRDKKKLIHEIEIKYQDLLRN